MSKLKVVRRVFEVREVENGFLVYEPNYGNSVFCQETFVAPTIFDVQTILERVFKRSSLECKCGDGTL